MPLNPSADIVFADGPLAAPYQPEKPAIRRIFKQVEQAIDAFSAGAGSIAKATKAQLDADLARGAMLRLGSTMIRPLRIMGSTGNPELQAREAGPGSLISRSRSSSHPTPARALRTQSR